MTRRKQNKSKTDSKKIATATPGPGPSPLPKMPPLVPIHIPKEELQATEPRPASPPRYKKTKSFEASVEKVRLRIQECEMQERLRKLELERELNLEELERLKAKAKEAEANAKENAPVSVSVEEPRKPDVEKGIMLQSIFNTISRGLYGDIQYIGPGPVYNDFRTNPFVPEMEKMSTIWTALRETKIFGRQGKKPAAQKEKSAVSKAPENSEALTVTNLRSGKTLSASSLEMTKRFATDMIHMTNNSRLSVIEIEIQCGGHEHPEKR